MTFLANNDIQNVHYERAWQLVLKFFSNVWCAAIQLNNSRKALKSTKYFHGKYLGNKKEQRWGTEAKVPV